MPQTKKEANRKYYLKNRKRILEEKRSWRKENYEEFAAQVMAYRKKYPSQHKARKRAYYRKNREKILEGKRELTRIKSKMAYWKDRDPQKYQEAYNEYVIYRANKGKKTFFGGIPEKKSPWARSTKNIKKETEE